MVKPVQDHNELEARLTATVSMNTNHGESIFATCIRSLIQDTENGGIIPENTVFVPAATNVLPF